MVDYNNIHTILKNNNIEEIKGVFYAKKGVFYINILI